MLQSRLATIHDLTACQIVLQQLHELGIIHGALDRQAFLILGSGPALTHRFPAGYLTDDTQAFEQEFASLHGVVSIEDESLTAT